MLRTVRAGGAIIEYELTQTARRSMELRAESDCVRLFAPRGVRLKDADAFVLSRAGWLQSAREQIQQYRDRYAKAHPVLDGAPILIEGRVTTLFLAPAARNEVRLEGDRLHVRAKDVSPEAVRALLKRFLTERCRAQIERRVDYYARLIGRSPVRIAIRDQKTRWGSCSSLGNLNFNWKLILAPPGALDYVVIHELCHLYELNHSARFWQRVRQYQADFAVYKRWLKENGQMLGI